MKELKDASKSEAVLPEVVKSADDKKLEMKRPSNRVAVGEQTISSIPEIPGFRTYLVTIDDPRRAGRKDKFEKAGYTPVIRRELYGDDCDKPDELDILPVDSIDGKVIHGLRMKIPTEWYEEDQAKKTQRNRATEAAVTTGEKIDVNRLLKSTDKSTVDGFGDF